MWMSSMEPMVHKALQDETLITINFDFTTGNEVSHIEGYKLKKKGISFETNCCEFFTFDSPCEVVVKTKLGKELTLTKLLENDDSVTDKEIRKGHNVTKMLLAGSFDYYLFKDGEF